MLKTLSKTPSETLSGLFRAKSRKVEGSKVEGKKLILTVMCLGCLFCSFEPLLGANAPADPSKTPSGVEGEKKKQDSFRAARLEKVAAFRADYPNVQIQTNPVTGVPEDLWGDLSKNQSQSDPVEATFEFYEQNKGLYGINNPREEFKVEGVSRHELGATVKLKQLYKGVQVYQSSVAIQFSRSGKLNGINGGFAQIADLSSTPAIDSAAAVEIVRKDLNLPKNYRSKILEWSGKAGRSLAAWIFVTSIESRYRLVWIVGAYVDSPQAHWEYIIDAHTGIIFKKKDTIKREPIRESGTRIAPPLPPTSKDSVFTPQPAPESSSVSGDKIPILPARPLDPRKTLNAPSETLLVLPPFPSDSASGLIENKALQSQDSLGTFQVSPVPIRLDRPMDSIIRDLQQGPEEPEVHKKKDDSSASNLSVNPATLADIMRQDFEGNFPGFRKNWYVFDNDSTINGEYFWDDDDYLPHPPTPPSYWSGWCAGGGANGLPGSSNYPNNMSSWMVFGPFSLSDASAAHLYFSWWNRSEATYDFFHIRASVDGENFYGYVASGNSGGWQSFDFNLASVPTLGDLRGRSGLWIAFIFTSDNINTDKGAFVDDIVLQKDAPAGTPDLVCYQPPFWAGPIVVSNQSGTNTQSQVYANRPAYIDWALKNIGTRATSATIWSNLLIDDTIRASYYLDPPYNTFDPPLGDVDFEWAFNTPGIHRVELKHDDYNTEMEGANEFNNSCYYDVNVLPCPPGDGIGTGRGVLNNFQNHVDINCFLGRYELLDLTREANNNPPLHNHNGQMQNNAAVWTLRWHISGYPGSITDADTVFDSLSQESGVDAQVYAGLTYDYLLHTLGRNGFDGVGDGMVSFVENASLSGTGVGAFYDTLNSRVNYATPNAFYRSLAGAIEIVGHEWGHGVTFLTSHLISEKESGALDESFSDMLGVSVDFAKGTFPNWQTAERVSFSGEPISDLADPKNPNVEPYRQPDTYRGQYWVFSAACTTDTCQRRLIHTNSGVPNKMFYLFAEFGSKTFNDVTVTGIGIDNAMKVMYLANKTGRWRDTTNFLQARFGSIQVADSLFSFWGAELRKAWDAVRVCKKADENGDGNITPADAVLLLNCIFLDTPPCNLCSADLNCDGNLRPADAYIVLNVIFLGSQNGKPDGCPDP